MPAPIAFVIGGAIGGLGGLIYGKNKGEEEDRPAATNAYTAAYAAPPAPVETIDLTKAVNPNIEKDKEKVPTLMEYEKIEKMAQDGNVCICRCWRSAKFPFCDGTHLKYNKETGDNVAPFVIKKYVPQTLAPEQAMGA